MIKTYVFGLILFLAYRLFYLFKLSQVTGITSKPEDIPFAFLIGFRYDTLILGYALMPSLFLGLCVFVWRNPGYMRFVSKTTPILNTILLILLTLINIVDIYYFTFFQSHISMIIFGLKDDETSNVLESLWKEYPIVKVLLLLLGLVLLFWYILRHFQLNTGPHLRWMKRLHSAFFVIPFLGLYLFGIHGTFSLAPLDKGKCLISTNSFVNLLPLNGPFALKEAICDKGKFLNLDGNIHVLHELGFEEASNAYATYLKKSNPTMDDFFATTKKDTFLEHHPPHVVFFMMESMSAYNLEFDSDSTQLYGNLKKHIQEDFLFTNFLSIANGTINTLEGILINTPVTPLAQSQYCNTNYISSVAKTYKDKGYETIFITGGNHTWRNINHFIPNQNFDYLESRKEIEKAIPNVKSCNWGVYDEYLFDYVYLKLSQAKKPLMIFVQTTTNHTPFELPKEYQKKPVHITQKIRQRKLLVEENIALKNLTSLQYANNCLGNFMTQLKTSPIKDKTIIAASGDHNNLMLFDFKEEMWNSRCGVPCYYYIPKQYVQNKTPDFKRWSSHRDIYPTLIDLSLSEAKYFKGGHSMFQMDSTQDYFAVNVMDMIAINQAGCVHFNPYVRRYFQWDKNHHELQWVEEPGKDLQELEKRASAYYAATGYFIRSQAIPSERTQNK